MPDSVKLYPNERVDLNDLKHGTSQFTRNEVQFSLLKLIQGHEPGGSVWDGFYVEKLSQATNPGKVRVINGFALDRVASALYKAPGTIVIPDNLFDNPNIAKEIQLPGSSTTHYVEVALVFVDGQDDARSFWDSTHDNGLDTSGDELPDGRETSRRVPVRLFPDWKVITNTTGFSWPSDLGTSGRTLRIPIAEINLDGGGAVTNPAEQASSTVIVTPTANMRVRCASVQRIQTTDILAFVSKDGTARLNTGVNEWPITSIDTVNNVITLADDPTAGGIVATDSFQVVDNSAGTPKSYLQEFRGPSGTFDSREKFFSELEKNTGIDPEALIADHEGSTPASYTAANGSGTGAITKSVSDGPFRTDVRLKSFKEWLRAAMFVINEIKHGSDFGSTTDGSYLVESWVGTRGNAEKSGDTNNTPLGSLSEVGNARLHYPLGDGTQRIQHSSLREALSAQRPYTVTVGPDSEDVGDFQGKQGLANAIQHINTNLNTGYGTLYLKAGSYDLTGINYGILTDPLELPAGWSIVGEFVGGVEIVVPNDRQFVIHLGQVGASDRLGQRIQNITFISEASARTASMVVFVVDTANLGSNGLGRPVAEVRECTFINDSGVTGAGSDRGMVRIAGTTVGTSVTERVLSFRDCTFAVDPSASTGQYVFEWSAFDKDSNFSSGAYGLPGCNFEGCTFLTFNNGAGIGYGCRVDTAGMLSGDYVFTFKNCSFQGGGVRTSVILSSWVTVTGAGSINEAFVFLDVHSCSFTALRNTDADKVGGGVYFDNPKGRLNVSSSNFQDLQWGVLVANGRESIVGCEFAACVAGILVGQENLATNINKLEIVGSSFVGELTRQDKGHGPEKAKAQTIGILLNEATGTHAYGVEDTDADDLEEATTVKISGCNFSEIGCAINAEPLTDNYPSLGDNGVSVELLEISGCSFFGIPGPAIDLGFIPSVVTTLRRAPIGTLIVTGCSFQWCSFRILPDIFTSGEGGIYPVTRVSDTNQFCVGCCAHRVMITGNSFNLIGIVGYTTLFSYATASFVRFLGVLGNDTNVATRSVIVKENSFLGYSNADSLAVDPEDPGGNTTNTKNQSWAGCFWVANYDTDGRLDDVVVSITGNTIAGDYRGYNGGSNISSDNFGQSGFYIAQADDGLGASGGLRFCGNDITLHQGQHGLVVTGLSLNDIEISSNFIRSLDAANNVNTLNGYPSGTAGAGIVQLVRLGGWRSEALYSVDSDGAVSGPQGVNDRHVLPTVRVLNNTFRIVGNQPTNPGTLDLTFGKRAGVLFDIDGGTGEPNAIFHGNNFLNCTLTLGEASNLGDIGYKYVVTQNVFTAHLPESSGDAGYIRGIFCHNHTHGEVDGDTYLPLDRVSVCVFRGNTIYNATVAFRAGNNNANSWPDSEIGYVLHLVSNTFYGRGNGREASEGTGSPAVVDRALKACFDFWGGNTTAGDFDPAINGNLELDFNWDLNDTIDNKAILIALNIFPPNVGGNNLLVGEAEATLIRDGVTLAGDTTINTDARGGFVIAGNMQMIKDSGDPWNVSGSQ